MKPPHQHKKNRCPPPPNLSCHHGVRIEGPVDATCCVSQCRRAVNQASPTVGQVPSVLCSRVWPRAPWRPGQNPSEAMAVWAGRHCADPTHHPQFPLGHPLPLSGQAFNREGHRGNGLEPQWQTVPGQVGASVPISSLCCPDPPGPLHTHGYEQG